MFLTNTHTDTPLLSLSTVVCSAQFACRGLISCCKVIHQTTMPGCLYVPRTGMTTTGVLCVCRWATTGANCLFPYLPNLKLEWNAKYLDSLTWFSQCYKANSEMCDLHLPAPWLNTLQSYICCTLPVFWSIYLPTVHILHFCPFFYAKQLKLYQFRSRASADTNFVILP